MSFFKVDHSEGQEFDSIPEGTYEVMISSVEIKTSSTGNPMLALQHTIRADVDQEAKKRKVFDNLVVTENAMFKFQNIAKATEMPDGKAFKNADQLLKEFAKHLKGKPLKITIKHDNTRDSFKEQVRGYAKSSLGAAPGSNPFDTAGQAGGKPPWEDGGKPIDISDDDLPF